MNPTFDQNAYIQNILKGYQSEAQQPTAQLQETNAAAGAAGASAQAATEEAQRIALDIKQKQLFSSYGDQMQKSSDPHTGLVSPSTYNSLKAQAVSAGVGITSDQFDQQFEHTFSDPTSINYNTSTGFANRNAAAEIKRQIQSQIDQFNQIPLDQKGLYGKANLVNQPTANVLFNSPDKFAEKLNADKMGGTNYLQSHAPEALGYEKSTAGLAAQLKGLIGGTGLRVTQPELDNWMSLLPSPSDAPATAQKKLSELDTSLKATFNTPVGLDPKYLASSTENPLQKAGILPASGEKTQPKGLDVLNSILQTVIPTGGAIGGGILGAALPVADLTGVPEIGGAAAGGAAGQYLADLLTGKKPGSDVAVTGALSGVGGVLGKVAGGVVGATGSGLAKYGSSLISKGLNLTPKMSADVAKDMGVKSVSDFLTSEGLQGANFDKLSDAVKPIQSKFDLIAKNPDIKIDPADVINGFDKQIRTLNNSILPSDHAKANALQSIGLNFIDRFGSSGSIGAEEMTALRQQVDKGVKDFGADPVVASAGNVTRTILQKAIQEADHSGNLKPLGQKLNQYYTLLSKVEPRQFASEGKSLLGAKDAIAGFLGNIFGGPVGAAGGIGLEKILGSKAGTQVLSKGATTLGNILRSGVIKKTATYGGITSGSGLGAILGTDK